VEYPGVLADGRIYFWQKESELYQWLYIQKGSIFEKFYVPVETNDGSLGLGTPPIVSSNGEYVIFSSDRDAADNYRKRSLYMYSLEDFELSKLTDNKLMTVYEVFISPDDNFIGFTYQNIEANRGTTPKALGVIVVATKTVNLFPHIQVNNLSIAFSQDSTHIFFTGQQGPSVFSISNGKILHSLESGVFRALSSRDLVVVEIEEEVDNLSFISNCLKEGLGGKYCK
jgi:hypothetical protein